MILELGWKTRWKSGFGTHLVQLFYIIDKIRHQTVLRRAGPAVNLGFWGSFSPNASLHGDYLWTECKEGPDNI